MPRAQRGSLLPYFAGQVPVIGKRAQQKLFAGRALVVGAGRVGVNVVIGLHTMGIGHIDVIDPQLVEAEQVGPYCFLTASAIGQPKAVAIARFLNRRRIGTVAGIHGSIESMRLVERLKPHDVIICCANTLPARLATERLAKDRSTTCIQAAVLNARGTSGGIIHVYRPWMRDRSCFRCYVGGHADGINARPGLVSSVTSVIGHLAVHTAFCEISTGRDRRQPWANLITVDLRKISVDSFILERRRDCSVCG